MCVNLAKKGGRERERRRQNKLDVNENRKHRNVIFNYKLHFT